MQLIDSAPPSPRLPMASDLLERIEERNAGGTHWDGCESAHVLCAAYLEIRKLRDVIATAIRDIEIHSDQGSALDRLSAAIGVPHDA